mgnify:CR=1 FL=1|tara:strand:- start:28340 stop:28495 length:156 start_codon:yes stop_codon:yes gene_type:complete
MKNYILKLITIAIAGCVLILPIIYWSIGLAAFTWLPALFVYHELDDTINEK